MELLLFYALSAIAVAASLGMVLNVRNTVAGAMSLVIAMIALGGIFVLLQAHLIAVIQIMVYAGAIVVLFLFVVMLLNLRRDAFPPLGRRWQRALGIAAGTAMLAGFLSVLPGALPEAIPVEEGFGGYRQAGGALFSDFVLPFEVTSLLLLSAVVGAVVLAKRRLD